MTGSGGQEELGHRKLGNEKGRGEQLGSQDLEAPTLWRAQRGALPLNPSSL